MSRSFIYGVARKREESERLGGMLLMLRLYAGAGDVLALWALLAGLTCLARHCLHTRHRPRRCGYRHPSGLNGAAPITSSVYVLESS